MSRNSRKTGRYPCDNLNEEQCEQREEPVQRLRGRKAHGIFFNSSKQVSVVRESIIRVQRDNRVRMEIRDGVDCKVLRRSWSRLWLLLKKDSKSLEYFEQKSDIIYFFFFIFLLAVVWRVDWMRQG